MVRNLPLQRWRRSDYGKHISSPSRELAIIKYMSLTNETYHENLIAFLVCDMEDIIIVETK